MSQHPLTVSRVFFGNHHPLGGFFCFFPASLIPLLKGAYVHIAECILTSIVRKLVMGNQHGAQPRAFVPDDWQPVIFVIQADCSGRHGVVPAMLYSRESKATCHCHASSPAVPGLFHKSFADYIGVHKFMRIGLISGFANNFNRPDWFFLPAREAGSVEATTCMTTTELLHAQGVEPARPASTGTRDTREVVPPVGRTFHAVHRHWPAARLDMTL